MADSKLELLIDIRSRLDELTKASSEMAKFRQEATGAGQALKTGFGVDLARRGLDLLTGTLREFALSAFVMADRIKDSSANLQLNTTAYQVLANVVTDAGGDIGLLSLAVQNSNRSLAEARNIGGAAANAYRQLGLDVARLEEMPVERRFDAIARAIASADDQTAAYSAASQILGSRNLPTLLGALRDLAREGYPALEESMKRAGRVMEEETIQRLERAKESIEKLKQAATISVGETIAVGDALVDSAKKDFWGTLRDLVAMGPMGTGSPALAVRLARDKPAPAPAPAESDTSAARRAQQLRAEQVAALAALEQRQLTRQTLIADPTLDEIERRQRLLLALEAEIAARRVLESVTSEMPLEGETELQREMRLFKLREETLRLEKERHALQTEGRVDAALGEVFGPLDRRTRARDAIHNFNAYDDPRSNPDYMSAGQGAMVGAAEWVSNLGSVGEQVADLMTNTIGAAVDGIADGIYGWITGAQSFGEAMMQLGGTVLRMVLQTIVQIAVQMLLNATIGRALQAAATAASIAQAAAVSAPLAAIWAGPATLATIATVGGAAAQAPASIALAKGTVLASSLAGFADGGYTGDVPRNQIAGVTHGREYVLNADATAAIGRDALDYANRYGRLPAPAGAAAPVRSGGLAVNQTSLGQAFGGSGESGRNIHVYLDHSVWLDAVAQDLRAIAIEEYARQSRV